MVLSTTLMFQINRVRVAKDRIPLKCPLCRMNTPFSTTNMIIRNKNVLVTSSSELNIYILIYIFSKNGVVEKE